MNIFSPKNMTTWSSLKRKKINWKFFGKIILLLSVVGFLALGGVIAWFAKDLPNPANLNERFIVQSTKIYDRTGNNLLYEVHGEEKRTQIDFSQMPETLRYATIALEDQDFYSHHGIKIKGIMRAAFKDVMKGDKAQGGSTITQQLVKRSILTSEKTLTRKIKEVILALWLETKFEKDDILGMYLNEIPYGSNAYGCQAAAQTFFGKNASELSLDESAILASLPQAPSRYSPYGSHTENLKARQEYALSQMARLGYITQEQADISKQEDVLGKIKPPSENINAPHFVMYIKDYLENKYGDEAVEQGGLKVFTTLDWEKQQIAEEAIRNNAEKNATQWAANNAALVAMDPKTGQVLAMVGSKDYFGTASPAGCVPGKNCKFEGNFNVATALRQPGSSFKPYVYFTAFTKGYTPETQIWDVDTNFSTDDGKKYNPKNYDGKNHGLLQLKNTLAMSLNVPAVKTLYLAGVKDSIATAKKMGITTLNEPDRYGLSLVLGGGEVKLVDHVNAYSAFATGGIHNKTTYILKVEGGNGEILEQYENTGGERVLEKKHVAMLDYVLSTNALRAPVFGENNPLSFPNRPVAAKTGTTNEWRDGWTIGYTPSLAVGVWAGNNDNTIMKPGADGSYVAAPIWRAFMDKALQNYDIEQFPKYEKEETGKDVLDGKLNEKMEIKVCRIPGTKNDYCLANDNCPDNMQDKKKFSAAHSILHYIQKDDPRGDPPSDPKNDPQYKEWEKAIKEFLKDNKDYGDGAPPDEECKAEDFKADIEVSIKNPSNNQSVGESFSIKASVDADNDIKKLSLSVDGSEVASNDNSSISYTFNASNYNGEELKIEAKVQDKYGNSDSASIKVKVSF